MKKEWTEAEINTMRILWEAGKTARHIGAVLHRSRNSIIGKINRIGAAVGEPKPAKVVPPAGPEVLRPVSGCQYPLGEYPYEYCGKPTYEGSSTRVYCTEHYKKCYRPRIGVSDKFIPENGAKIIRPIKGWGSPLARLR